MLQRRLSASKGPSPDLAPDQTYCQITAGHIYKQQYLLKLKYKIYSSAKQTTSALVRYSFFTFNFKRLFFMSPADIWQSLIRSLQTCPAKTHGVSDLGPRKTAEIAGISLRVIARKSTRESHACINFRANAQKWARKPVAHTLTTGHCPPLVWTQCLLKLRVILNNVL